jgi:hypothetical protein
MPFLRNLLTKLNALPAFVFGLLKRTAAALGAFSGALLQRVEALIRGLLEKLPKEKRRPLLLAGGAGAIVLLLVFFGVLLIMNSGRARGASSAELPGPERGAFLPPEELFLPPEPDFLPGVLLDRERKRSWTDEDARPYWQDPLRNGEEPWRNRIEAAIDDLMERVP